MLVRMGKGWMCFLELYLGGVVKVDWVGCGGIGNGTRDLDDFSCIEHGIFIRVCILLNGLALLHAGYSSRARIPETTVILRNSMNQPLPPQVSRHIPLYQSRIDIPWD
jgi:hypothetical protein